MAGRVGPRRARPRAGRAAAREEARRSATPRRCARPARRGSRARARNRSTPSTSASGTLAPEVTLTVLTPVEPGLVDLARVVDAVGRLGAGLERDLDEADRVGRVAGAHHDHQVGVARDLLDGQLAVLGGVADVVARAGRAARGTARGSRRPSRASRRPTAWSATATPPSTGRAPRCPRRRPDPAPAGCARVPRRRCPRPPRGPRGRSAGCRSPGRRTAWPRGATLVTSGQVASMVFSWRSAASACTAGETPWAENTTVWPSGTSSSSSTKIAPRDSRSATTCLLCTICLRT